MAVLWRTGAALASLGAVFLLLAASSGAAGAELIWPDLTLSSYVGVGDFDRSHELTGSIPLGVRGGFTIAERFGFEVSFGKVFADSRRVPRREYPMDQWGVDLLFNGFPASRINPYVLVGWAQLNLDEPTHRILRMPGGEFGGGLKIRLLQDAGARWDLRIDARNIVARNRAPLEGSGDYKNHFVVTAGISMTLANPDRDTDGDGVLDRLDRCPGTVPGATVDPFGCVLDYDEDGVPDGIDRCPSTPQGALVDDTGCPSDRDGDGVMDGIDLCDETLPGVVVDAAGCALDTDSDGVFDGLDLCPGTPPRVLVDEYGCPLTPTVSAAEVELLNTGILVLDNIYFETGAHTLKSESFPVLDQVGEILRKWDELRIEISGHTDSRGEASDNLELSRNRAQAVLDHLKSRFPSLEVERFEVVGRGESQPVASNETEEGRSRNRRVEFKVLNPGVLRRIR